MFLEDKRGEDTAEVAERNLERTANSALLMGPQVCREPADDNRSGGEDAGLEDEEGKVFHAGVGEWVVGVGEGEEDDEADDADEDGANDKEKALLEAVRIVCCCHGYEPGEEPDWYSAELGFDWADTPAGDDGGVEVGEGVHGDEHKAVEEGGGEELVVGDDDGEVAELELFVFVGGSDVLCETLLDEGSFGIAEPFDIFGEVGAGVVADYSNDTGHYSFENEDPSPWAETTSFNVANSVG